MKHLLTFTLLAGWTLLTLGKVSGQAPSKKEKVVRKSYEAYCSAVDQKNAGDAIKMVSEATIAYFDMVVILAKTASKEELSNTSLMEKIQILTIRQEYTASQIQSLTGTQFLKDRFAGGLSAREHISANNLGAISVDGELATAEIMDGERPTGYFLQFIELDGNWQVDLVSIFSMSDSLLDMILTQQGLSHEQYLARLLPMTTGKPLEEGNWQPIQP